MPPGARNKFGAPCSNLRSFGSKWTVDFKTVVLKKVLMTLLWLFASPQWFGAQGIVLLRPPSLRLWCYAINIGKFSENKKFSSPNIMYFYSMNICNFRTQYSMDLAQTANKGYWRHFRFLRVVFVALLCLPHAFFRRGPVFVLLKSKTFPTSNKLLLWG